MASNVDREISIIVSNDGTRGEREVLSPNSKENSDLHKNEKTARDKQRKNGHKRERNSRKISIPPVYSDMDISPLRESPVASEEETELPTNTKHTKGRQNKNIKNGRNKRYEVL